MAATDLILAASIRHHVVAAVLVRLGVVLVFVSVFLLAYWGARRGGGRRR